MIKALCRQDPSERIGYQRAGVADIRKHRWFQVIYCFTCDLFQSRLFQGFDWDALRNESLPAPHVPEIKSCTDVGNFEKIREEDISKIPEETSGWDDEF